MCSTSVKPMVPDMFAKKPSEFKDPLSWHKAEIAQHTFTIFVFIKGDYCTFCSVLRLSTGPLASLWLIVVLF